MMPEKKEPVLTTGQERIQRFFDMDHGDLHAGMNCIAQRLKADGSLEEAMQQPQLMLDILALAKGMFKYKRYWTKPMMFRAMVAIGYTGNKLQWAHQFVLLKEAKMLKEKNRGRKGTWYVVEERSIRMYMWDILHHPNFPTEEFFEGCSIAHSVNTPEWYKKRLAKELD